MADSHILREITNAALNRVVLSRTRLTGIRQAWSDEMRYADHESLAASLDSVRLELSVTIELLRDIRASLPTD